MCVCVCVCVHAYVFVHVGELKCKRYPLQVNVAQFSQLMLFSEMGTPLLQSCAKILYHDFILPISTKRKMKIRN